ncbi:MAG: NAD(P)H-quinone oxidoreductase [Kordiimonadaceae bacterium]|nr:NAD(P)H-quinone oxidoreductase [Kordiimonadaceae bacterium]MBT6037449.1 NAD(P)H-quinone oxidoreductase [Kordiimonadaceae bacterium]MBT6330103.1 NAD(P)H-quinone oxidoreductase [Kordiimonadaceae bacterium]MBT7583805.1 NAD(P)H-quinone oxidoreductase [Kordiimonadaceae bacterium]
MKTIEIREFGQANVLETGARDLPELRSSEVLVRIFAAGVNGPDLVQRRGHYPPPKGASDLLGLEISGEVVAVGVDITNWAVGDHLCALTNGGGYAEYVAVEATHCLPIPAHISNIDAAGLCETYFTVWSNLFFNQTITANDLLLVHGGSGGIGSTAIQLGSELGMRVYTTCGSAENCSYVESLGAERSINYKEEDFVDVVRGAGGANLILDIIGGDYIARNIKAASADARIVQLAFNAGSKVEINMMPIMLKRLIYTGSTLRSRPEQFKSDVASDLMKNVWPMFEKKKLFAQTHKVFSFEQASEAHSMMEASQHRGKILLSPN